MFVCMMQILMMHISMILDPDEWCMCPWCGIFSGRTDERTDGRSDEQADSRSWMETLYLPFPVCSLQFKFFSHLLLLLAVHNPLIFRVHSKWITGPGPRMLKVLKTETYRMNCQTIYSDIMGSMYMKNHWSGRIGIGNTMGSWRLFGKRVEITQTKHWITHLVNEKS